MTRTADIPDIIVTRKPVVSFRDRIGFTLFVALILHATLIFGVSFTSEISTPAPIHLEVTLAEFIDDETPENADYLAQVNQQGSGEQEKKSQITTNKRAQSQASKELHAAQRQPAKTSVKAAPVSQAAVVSAAVTDTRVSKHEIARLASAADEPKKKTLLRNALEIASLEAKLDHQRKIYAKRPRVTRLTSVSAKASATAFYMQNWVRKVERVGNLNYPEQARQRGLAGKVRVAVLINDKGGVESVEILESSGMSVLDDAVIRIVRLAEPFGAFTASMRKEADQFEIIRTFDFARKISSF